MANTYVAIATVTVGSGGAADIEFTSIPQTYTDLLLVISGRKTTSGVTDLGLRINSLTTGYNFRSIGSNGSTVTNGNFTNFSYYYQEDALQGSDSTASTFSSSQVYIPNYTSSNNKVFSGDAVTENNATTAYTRMSAADISTSSAISSILIKPGTGNWAQYSTATLYGIKNT